jgi:hypothetical protein
VPLPYQPTSNETEIIFQLYLKSINVYELIKDRLNEIIPGEKTRDNNITRTYYIYKIIEAVWDNNSPMQTILPFIHLQQSKTIQTHDLIWEFICKKINLKYRPTERFN